MKVKVLYKYRVVFKHAVSTRLPLSQAAAKPCLCGKSPTQTYIQLHVGKFKWSVQKVPQVFWERTGGAKIFSVCRSIPVKCMSSVFSSQRCYLSSGFLCIVKLLCFRQYAVYIVWMCLLDLQYDKPFDSLFCWSHMVYPVLSVWAMYAKD